MVAAQLKLELPVRMGIATREAELRGADYFGAVLNRAARVMAAGQPDKQSIRHGRFGCGPAIGTEQSNRLKWLVWRQDQRGIMSDNELSPTMLLDELATLDPAQRRVVAEELRKVADTFAEVSDGKTASHVLGVLAHLLDSS